MNCRSPLCKNGRRACIDPVMCGFLPDEEQDKPLADPVSAAERVVWGVVCLIGFIAFVAWALSAYQALR